MVEHHLTSFQNSFRFQKHQETMAIACNQYITNFIIDVNGEWNLECLITIFGATTYALKFNKCISSCALENMRRLLNPNPWSCTTFSLNCFSAIHLFIYLAHFETWFHAHSIMLCNVMQCMEWHISDRWTIECQLCYAIMPANINVLHRIYKVLFCYRSHTHTHMLIEP